MQFCSYVIFLLRDQWLIERLSEEMGAALVGNNFSPIPSKFSFQMKKKSNSTRDSRPEIYKALKPCWLLNWVSIARVVACFPQASLSLPAVTAATCKRPVLVLASPARASRAGVQPQELGSWFCPLNLRLPSGSAFGEIARWPALAWTWTQTWTVPPDQRVVKVL